MTSFVNYLLSELFVLCIAFIGLLLYAFHPTKPKLPQSLSKLLTNIRKDFALIYKKDTQEVFMSQDRNTMYLKASFTKDWERERVVLYMLSARSEFIAQIKANDLTAFEAILPLVEKLQLVTMDMIFKHLHVLPMFTKHELVWKLPLLPTPLSSPDEVIKTHTAM